MLRRLKRLGINKTNPDDLNPEEVLRFVRLGLFFLRPFFSNFPSNILSTT
jgi:hypothetical protein